jgi:multidrug resistance efflux pump
MVFVHTSGRDQAVGAAFQQNAPQRVKSGDDAEIAFDAVPGRVFRGKVHDVLDAIATGQLQPTGVLQDFGATTSGGRAMGTIDIEEDISSYQIPLGAAAQVAIYTKHFEHLALLRRILLRMRSWENFVFMEDH